MKDKLTFFAIGLAMALALPMYAQYTPDTIHKSGIKQQVKESMMGKPTYQATSGDLIFSIWITTQEDHKKMMAEMSEKGMDKDMEGIKDKDKGMDKDMDTKEVKDMGMKKDSSNMRGKGMQMDEATKDAMMAGTHHMMVEVKNTAGGKETNAISAKVEIVSPTKKTSSVDLKMHMADHFGSGITLNELGEYQLTVSVIVGKVAKTIKLKYTVK